MVLTELDHVAGYPEGSQKECDESGHPVLLDRSSEPLSSTPSSDVGATILEEYKALPPMSFAEKFIACTFVAMAVLFFTRAPGDTTGWASLFPNEEYITDGTVSMMCALLLFIVPTKGVGLGLDPSTNAENMVQNTILDWTVMEKIPWNVVFLLGGGFALSTGFLNVGLSPLIARNITAGNLPLFKLTMLSVLLCMGITNFVSNVATANMFLPSLACVPPSMPGQPNPIKLLAPLTLACSVALMLPVGTPPNAIAFASKAVTIRDLVFVGGILTVLSMVLILTFVEYLALSWAFDSKSSENIIDKCQV